VKEEKEEKEVAVVDTEMIVEMTEDMAEETTGDMAEEMTGMTEEEAEAEAEAEEGEDSVLQEIQIIVSLLKIFLLVAAGKILKIILEPLVMFASLTLEEEETADKWESLSTNIMMT
jgi:hypothetical protein